MNDASNTLVKIVLFVDLMFFFSRIFIDPVAEPCTPQLSHLCYLKLSEIIGDYLFFSVSFSVIFHVLVLCK